MRTTLTVDDSVIRALKERAHRERKTFQQVVHETLVRGLAAPERSQDSEPFVVEAQRCGFVPGIDYGRLNQLSDDLEAADFREESIGKTE